ncbi:hypothetical protein SAY86_000436 [Trapa natans]|nr:hypothetical protein SAY86_000436 [Trapa natans]
MDKDGNKRKAAAQHHDRRSEEDDEEESKMEEFFALIRRTREIRDQLNLGKSAGQDSSNPNRREPAKGSYWAPKLVVEDFKDGGGPSMPPPPLPVNEEGGRRRQKEEGKKQDSTELDLELSL